MRDAELDDFLDAICTGEDPDDLLRIARDVVCLVESAEASLRDGGAKRHIPVAVSRGA